MIVLGVPACPCARPGNSLALGSCCTPFLLRLQPVDDFAPGRCDAGAWRRCQVWPHPAGRSASGRGGQAALPGVALWVKKGRNHAQSPEGCTGRVGTGQCRLCHGLLSLRSVGSAPDSFPPCLGRGVSALVHLAGPQALRCGPVLALLPRVGNSSGVEVSPWELDQGRRPGALISGLLLARPIAPAAPATLLCLSPPPVSLPAAGQH